MGAVFFGVLRSRIEEAKDEEGWGGRRRKVAAGAEELRSWSRSRTRTRESGRT